MDQFGETNRILADATNKTGDCSRVNEVEDADCN